MSLMKCVECGGMVSSRAAACPHCGCPVTVNNGTICVIDGVEHDLVKILELSKQGHVGPPRGRAGDILVRGNIISDDDFWELWEVICQTGKIPAEFHSGDLAKDILATGKTDATPGQPKCPTCGSAYVEQINLSTRAAATVLFGVVSKTARSQFRCRNCGYKF